MPEIIPINASVHYKCAFNIHPSVSQPMTHIRIILRHWCIQKKVGKDSIMYRPWFFIGNNPRTEPAQYIINDHQLRTASAPSEAPKEPTMWGLEIVHGDSDESARRWSVEATLRKQDNENLRFTTVIRHWMIPYYIGKYPEPPAPSVPGYVRNIVDDPNLICVRGDTQIESNPISVTNENARRVFDNLISGERQLPFVFIAFDTNRQRLLVNPLRVMAALTGSANVFVLGTPSVVDELNYYLGEDFSCQAGSVRVYLPQLNRSNPANARHHRYLSATFIEEHGEDGIIHFLTNGLSRNGATFKLSDLTSFMDIMTERRKHTIKRLAADRQGMTEETKMVWEENDKLASQVSSWETLASQYESENQQLQEKVSSLAFRIAEAERVRQRLEDLESQVKGLHDFTKLPTDLAEILACMAKLFPNRLDIADDAINAARRYSEDLDKHWCKPEQLALAWKMVFDAATILYKLLFHEQSNQLEREFDSVSQFELAMNEGKQTRKDAQLMKLRRIVHKGKDYDITPHIKYGTKAPKVLRLYFSIDQDTKSLVIGHFGEHLDNYSTRKQS